MSSPSAAVAPAITTQSGRLAEPFSLEQRLRALRKRRSASRFSRAAGLTIWIVGLAALALIVGGVLLGTR